MDTAAQFPKLSFKLYVTVCDTDFESLTLGLSLLSTVSQLKSHVAITRH